MASKAAQVLAEPVSPTVTSTGTGRYLALDAFRGFIMLMLISAGFGFEALARRDPAFLPLAAQFEHMDWEWITFWDLIQPAFMFMVGVAMPFAMAKRIEQGATQRELLWHACMRSFRLLVMSQVLISISRGSMQFQLTNVLAQIAITYFACYLIMQFRFSTQIIMAALILAGHWGLFVLFPGTEGPFYSKTTNVGSAIDRFLFGRDNPGHWVSTNWISSTVTTLFGVWSGRLLASSRPSRSKLRILALGAASCLAAGWMMHPWIPIVKRICTSSFIVYSTGWVLLMLMAFYWLVEVKQYRRWTFPLVVLGANSIFIYSVDMVLRGWLNKAVGVFTLNFEWLGQFAPVLQSCAVLAVLWWLCYWLFRRGIFLKL